VGVRANWGGVRRVKGNLERVGARAGVKGKLGREHGHWEIGARERRVTVIWRRVGARELRRASRGA
jgi:hypothetical protein